jgi:hypothetical protein
LAAPCLGALRLAAQVPRHPVKPAAQGLARARGPRPAREDQERRLEDVVGQPGVAEQPATQAAHHRPVPPYQGGKRRLIAQGGVTLEQLVIRAAVESSRVLPAAEVTDERIGDGTGHQLTLRPGAGDFLH